MPAYSYEERLPSRTVTRNANGTEVKRVYQTDSDDPEAILLSSNLPVHMEVHPTLPNLYVDQVDIEPPILDGETCRVVVTYKEWPRGMTPDGETWTWDIGSEMQQITSVPNASYVWHYPAASDAGLAINTDGETTNGVSVYRPTLSLTVSKIWPYVTSSARLALEEMIATTNVAAWMDYGIGEVLFTGVQFRRQTDGTILATYKFEIARHLGTQTITLYDGSTVVIDPYPHDYVWFRFLDTKEDTGAEKIVKRGIQSVHVNQVYGESDFSLFGLTGPLF